VTQVKIPARDMIFEVRAADNVTYVAVSAVSSFLVNPGENEETADTTTYDSDGNYEERKMQRGASIKIEGFMHKDDATGAQDTGQARLETLGTLVGEASLGRVRFRHPMDTLWKVWDCTVSLAEQGGANNDETKWGCTVMRTGASTTAAAP
jgi:hypothetical protein